MAKLAKATQTALDELDWPYTVNEINHRFIPNARVALGHLPCACFDSIARVATALAKNDSNSEIPMGYGSACVRHFYKRNEQLDGVLGVSVERRFALIELTSLASIAGRWAHSSEPRVTGASHKECLRHVAQVAESTCIEREQWRTVIAFLLESPSSTPIFFRNVAYVPTRARRDGSTRAPLGGSGSRRLGGRADRSAADSTAGLKRAATVVPFPSPLRRWERERPSDHQRG